jgi:hypothetical protein
MVYLSIHHQLSGIQDTPWLCPKCQKPLNKRLREKEFRFNYCNKFKKVRQQKLLTSFNEDAAWCFLSERSRSCTSFLWRLAFVSAVVFPWASTIGVLPVDSFGGFCFEAKEMEGEGSQTLVPSSAASSLK